VNPAPRPARILLVDDSAADVEAALRAFRELHLTNEILVARDGAEALDLLLGRRVGADGSPYPLPDVLLLDLVMDGIDGLEVLRRVREAPVLRRLPVVFLVASPEEGERVGRTTRGTTRSLVKPLALEDVLDVVRGLDDAWLTVTVQPAERAARRPVSVRPADTAPAPGPLHLLIVEDSPTDAEVVAMRLEAEGLDFDWERVDTEEGFRRALETGPDVILCDWTLPRFSGLRALQVRQELGLDTPFVIVSGRVGEEAAIEALQHGADDYVLKDRLARLGTAIRRALAARRQLREHARADDELRLAAAWFEATAEGVMVTDPDGSILAVNRAFTEITGYAELEVVGRNPRLLKSGRQDEAFYRSMWGSLRASGHWRGELWNRRKNGEVYPEWSTISAVRDAEGQVTRYVEVFSDIGEFKKAQADIDFLVHHDALTGLPNRALLEDRLAEAIRRATGQDSVIAVAILDLDRFGDVNDTLGHLAGDDVLRVLARRLAAALGPQDTLGRVGGDDFAVVLGRVGSADHAATRVRDLQDRLAEPVHVATGDVVVTASAGISIHPTDGEDAAILLRHAETALRELSAASRNTIGFFEAEMAEQFAERVGLEQALRGALGRGELTVSYQPQLGLADGALVGAEALTRWRHPERGMIPPAVFIPLAEEMGIVGEIGAWVLGEACRQVAAWQSDGFALPRVAVNLSAAQLEEPDLASRVQSALDDAGVGPERLELEVTESMVMGQSGMAEAVLADLRGLGVELAMDDFGTGHSSLVQLRRLPLARLKIDLSFVRDIGHDATAEEIVRAITAMAGGLGLETVAEGVETEAHADFLREAGCTLGQGYLWSRPVPAPELLAAVRRGELGTRAEPSSLPQQHLRKR
jgi:diguanylate cyclase (GGDEF)-like protein/PAS domain S-box-containing protein